MTFPVEPCPAIDASCCWGRYEATNREATNQNKILLNNSSFRRFIVSSFRPLHPMRRLRILSLLFQRVHPQAGPFFVVG